MKATQNLYRQKLDGSDAILKVIENQGVWADCILRSEVTMPLEIKSDVEYVILEYDVKTQFIGMKSIVRIPTEQIEIWKKVAGLSLVMSDKHWSPCVFTEAVSHDIVISRSMPWHITEDKVIYILQAKQEFVFPMSCSLIMLIEGFHLVNHI